MTSNGPQALYELFGGMNGARKRPVSRRLPRPTNTNHKEQSMSQSVTAEPQTTAQSAQSAPEANVEQQTREASIDAKQVDAAAQRPKSSSEAKAGVKPAPKPSGKSGSKSSSSKSSNGKTGAKSKSTGQAAAIAKARADVKAGRKRPSEAAMGLLAQEQQQLKAALKAAQMSESSELTDEQRKRALDHPAKMTGATLRSFIVKGRSSDGKPSTRSPEHSDVAKRATELVRTGAPKRGGVSTHAIASTLAYVGRKDVSKLFAGVSDTQAAKLAKGQLRVSELSDEQKTAVAKAVAKIRETSNIVRFDARMLFAAIVASKATS